MIERNKMRQRERDKREARIKREKENETVIKRKVIEKERYIGERQRMKKGNRQREKEIMKEGK